ncbi:uncharacterized protein PgNI_04010 [Pyricularia grisea]|uniref:DUF7053 domain-containing protein n=1 Tax=Pyricularia grisea TaxID=148305 RepID=A0A6P8B8A9_PYRGI|nr:uncharacterized protein PgNI_04010 [Pyricularia grisea]TLD12016.1 hypothetical protein PgNI_04010 [Pyricularia grisea]
MSKRTVYTEISPLPPNISRQVVLDFLHDHLGMIDLNPLVKERHPIPPPAGAAPEEKHLNWYSLTDKISYLPGGLATGDISYTAVFNDLPNGLQTHCWAPLGVEIRSRWTLNGTLPGEPPEKVELGLDAPTTGLYIREDVELRCNILMAGFIKKTTKKAHQTLVEQVAAKAQASADLDATTAAASTPGSAALRGNKSAARFSDYSQVRSAPEHAPPIDGTGLERNTRGEQGGDWRAHGHSSSDGDLKKMIPDVIELPASFSFGSEFRPSNTPASQQPRRFSAMPPPSSNCWTTAPLPSKPHFSPRQPAYQESRQEMPPPPPPSFLVPPRPPAPQNLPAGTPQRQSLDLVRERLYTPYNPGQSKTTARAAAATHLASLIPPSPSSTNSSIDSEEDYLGDGGECVDRASLYPNPLCVQKIPAMAELSSVPAAAAAASSGTPAIPQSAAYPEMSPYSEDDETCSDMSSLPSPPASVIAAAAGMGTYGLHPAPLRPGFRRATPMAPAAAEVPAALRPGSSPNINFGSSWRHDLR